MSTEHQVLYRTEGGRTDCPTLDYGASFYTNAELFEEKFASYHFDSFRGQAKFTSARLQQSKDETEAVLRADFKGSDFSGYFEVHYHGDKPQWIGEGHMMSDGAAERTGRVNTFQQKEDGTAALTWEDHNEVHNCKIEKS